MLTKKFKSNLNQSAFGLSAGQDNTGSNQSAFGYAAGYLNQGANNSNFGSSAGRYIADGTTTNTNSDNSVFLGYQTRALALANTNTIVIGANVTGNGSNTTTIGNASTVLSVLRGTLRLPDCPTSSAGLVAGDIWSNAGVLTIV